MKKILDYFQSILIVMIVISFGMMVWSFYDLHQSGKRLDELREKTIAELTEMGYGELLERDVDGTTITMNEEMGLTGVSDELSFVCGGREIARLSGDCVTHEIYPLISQLEYTTVKREFGLSELSCAIELFKH